MCLRKEDKTSGQDGGVGTHASPPRTTIEKNYNQFSQTNNTQNHQKSKLYGSLTTKDLKKPHSSRWVGGVESWRWDRKVVCHGEVAAAVAAEWMVPHLHVVDKNQKGDF